MLASCWSHVQVPEFQGLPASTIESLALVLTEKVFPPKAVIYYQGSEVEDVYFVQRGTVTVSPYHSSYIMTFALAHMRAARLELTSRYDNHGDFVTGVVLDFIIFKTHGPQIEHGMRATILLIAPALKVTLIKKSYCAYLMCSELECIAGVECYTSASRHAAGMHCALSA